MSSRSSDPTTASESPQHHVCQCFEAETDEVQARVQFVRVVSFLCDHHAVTWTVVGGFLRRLFSSSSMTGCNMDFFLHPLMLPESPRRPVQKLLKDLEILGFLSEPVTRCSYRPEIYIGKVFMYHRREIMFDVIIDTTPPNMRFFAPAFSSDTLQLTSTGFRRSAKKRTRF